MSAVLHTQEEALQALSHVLTVCCVAPSPAQAPAGVVLPSFITILAVSFAIAQFEHIKIVQYAFTGIRAAVLALIIRALAAMYKECPKSPLSYIIAAAAFFVAAFTSINTIFIILGCAAVGLAVHLVFNTKNGKAGEGK